MRFPPSTERKKHPSECNRCKGTITERSVTLPLPNTDETLRLVEGVPAGVCDQCQEYYLTALVSRTIDELMAAPPSRDEIVSVWEYVPSP